MKVTIKIIVNKSFVFSADFTTCFVVLSSKICFETDNVKFKESAERYSPDSDWRSIDSLNFTNSLS